LTANSDRLSHFGRRISLFLQTLVLRSILSSEQEHRQERISVGMMRLWPIGSTRGEEANEFEIGNLHPLGPRAVSALTAYLKVRPKESPYVFPGPTGQRLTRGRIWQCVSGIDKRALGRRISPHSLRRAFATALLKGGADIRDVQALMRHAGVETTALYIQLDLNFLRKTYYETHPQALLAKATDRRFSNTLPGLQSKP